MSQVVFFLGVGPIARAVRAALPEHMAIGTTRSAPDARFAAIRPISTHDAEAVRAAADNAQVVVSLPPDGRSDAILAPLIANARSITYVSSTSVYPANAALVTEATATGAESERGRRRLAAEAIWLSVGASVVRLPAFYGPDSGLHASIARGTFRIPGAGTNIVSRVHVDDAARFVIAAAEAPLGSILLAGDDEPARVIDVVRFVCEQFGLAFPETSVKEQVAESLRGNRAVDNQQTKIRFDIRLAYPTYRAGYHAVYQNLRGK